MAQITGSPQLQTISGPGYGVSSYLEGMRRFELKKFCDAFGLMDAARKKCKNDLEAANPPAVLMRQAIAEAGMTGREEVPVAKKMEQDVAKMSDEQFAEFEAKMKAARQQKEEPRQNGYDTMKMSEVRKACSEKGIKYTPSHKKVELIEMLKNA